MATGTVKWFNDEKGYGFITPDGEGRDLFVHYSSIAGGGFRSLAEGTKVSYEEEPGDKDLLSASEYSKLVTAYKFLRHLEHRLQFEDDRQTHTLPTDPRHLDLLARRNRE